MRMKPSKAAVSGRGHTSWPMVVSHDRNCQTLAKGPWYRPLVLLGRGHSACGESDGVHSMRRLVDRILSQRGNLCDKHPFKPSGNRGKTQRGILGGPGEAATLAGVPGRPPYYWRTLVGPVGD